MSIDSENQKQHVIPQVYLKRFGFQEKGGQWKLSTVKKGEKKIEHKNIKSFERYVNIFDIDSPSPEIKRIFETLNGELETNYNKIIENIESGEDLTDVNQFFLQQLIVNLIVRSDFHREWVKGLLNHNNKPHFIKFIIGHHCTNKEEYDNIEHFPLYKELIDLPTEKALNKVLMYYSDHLLLRLQNFSVVILKTEDDKPLGTSTNPVVLNRTVTSIETLPKNTEIYLPLTPNLIAYLYLSNEELITDNIFRRFPDNKVSEINEEQAVNVRDKIINNPAKVYILPNKFDRTIRS